MTPVSEHAKPIARSAIDSLIRQFSEATSIQTEGVRSIEVLLQSLLARPTWFSGSQIEALVTPITPRLLEFVPNTKDDAQPGDASNKEMLRCYRRSCLIAAISRLLEWNPPGTDLKPELLHSVKETRQTAQQLLKKESKRLVEELQKIEVSELHPFITCQLLQALKLIEKPELVNDVEDVRRRILKPQEELLTRLLANHQLGLDNASESVALAFSAAAASNLTGEEAGRQSRAALRACVASYERSVGWEQGRVICQDPSAKLPRHQMVVPGAEVYCAVGKAALTSYPENSFLDDLGERSVPAGVLELLERGLRVANDSKVDGTAPPGWAMDQILGNQATELWPTAAVLRLALVTDEVRHRQERQEVLERLDGKPSWGDDWPGWLKWGRYRDTSDPDSEAPEPILKFIDAKIVKPREGDQGAAAANRASIMLLFGPPGTTKTTIARAVAGGLEWPIVTLSPGNFTEEGLDRVEARARKIFDDLESLSRAVVIFDECDELFRERAPAPQTESFRNESAFMTASMLPKLQDLHDRGRVVVFICTNFLSSIDPAMRRIGRIDHLVAVGPPDTGQRRGTIELELEKVEAPEAETEQQKNSLATGIEELVKHTEFFIRGELVNAARNLAELRPYETADAAKYAARRIAGGIAKTIKPESKTYAQFEKDREELSEPHRKEGFD